MDVNTSTWIVALFIPLIVTALTVIVWRAWINRKVREEETKPKAMLKGAKDTSDNALRVEFLRNLMDNAHKDEQFIQSIRERTFHLALIAFAGIFVFLCKRVGQFNPWFISIAFFSIIYCLFLHDLRLHRFRHAWRATKAEFAARVVDAMNEHTSPIKIILYQRKGERQAARWKEFIRVRRWIYYLMLIASFLSPFLIIKWGLEQ